MVTKSLRNDSRAKNKHRKKMKLSVDYFKDHCYGIPMISNTEMTPFYQDAKELFGDMGHPQQEKPEDPQPQFMDDKTFAEFMKQAKEWS